MFANIICLSLIPLFDFKFKNFRKIVVVVLQRPRGLKAMGNVDSDSES